MGDMLILKCIPPLPYPTNTVTIVITVTLIVK